MYLSDTYINEEAAATPVLECVVVPASSYTSTLPAPTPSNPRYSDPPPQPHPRYSSTLTAVTDLDLFHQMCTDTGDAVWQR